MKTAEDLKKEFIEKWSQFGMQEGLKNAIKEEMLSDLNALISEHYYPKEFVEWKDKNVMRYFGGWIFNYGQPSKPRFKDTDELFNYWKENVK